MISTKKIALVYFVPGDVKKKKFRKMLEYISACLN